MCCGGLSGQEIVIWAALEGRTRGEKRLSWAELSWDELRWVSRLESKTLISAICLNTAKISRMSLGQVGTALQRFSSVSGCKKSLRFWRETSDIGCSADGTKITIFAIKLYYFKVAVKSSWHIRLWKWTHKIILGHLFTYHLSVWRIHRLMWFAWLTNIGHGIEGNTLCWVSVWVVFIVRPLFALTDVINNRQNWGVLVLTGLSAARMPTGELEHLFFHWLSLDMVAALCWWFPGVLAWFVCASRCICA